MPSLPPLSESLFPGRGGARVGPYELVRPLGRGGMAEVFLAVDRRRTGIHQLVALKTLADRVADSADHLEMFHDEARVASRIKHPNVCEVMDFGFDRGRPFLVMEFVCGENLRTLGERFSGGIGFGTPERLTPLVTILADAAHGLHATHELRALDGTSLDAVHRDVTPDNILVSCTGTVKVVDFGVVKAMSNRHQTQEGIIKGKMAYVAPECLTGATVDRRADVWALGVILWELLVGERLFRKDSDVETLRALLNTTVRPPSEVHGELPDAFDELVLQALSHDPDVRPPTARAFAERLTRSAAQVGAASDRFALEGFLHDHFSHDATCLPRHLRDAQAVEDVAVEVTEPSLDDEPRLSFSSLPPASAAFASWPPVIPAPPPVPAAPSSPPPTPSIPPPPPSWSPTPSGVWMTSTHPSLVLPAPELPASAPPREGRWGWAAIAMVALASALLASSFTRLVGEASAPVAAHVVADPKPAAPAPAPVDGPPAPATPVALPPEPSVPPEPRAKPADDEPAELVCEPMSTSPTSAGCVVDDDPDALPPAAPPWRRTPPANPSASWVPDHI